MTLRRLPLAAIVLLGSVGSAHAVDPAYLEEWPAPERALADFQGQDSQDTMAP